MTYFHQNHGYSPVEVITWGLATIGVGLLGIIILPFIIIDAIWTYFRK
jgi:hypothetical protein